MIDWENFYEAIDGIREHEQKSWRDVANWLEMSARTLVVPDLSNSNEVIAAGVGAWIDGQEWKEITH